MSDEPKHVAIGTRVFDDEGTQLGRVRGFEDDGFFVATVEGIEALSVEHERAGHEFGEATLMWQCGNCGEMGDIEALPEECPNCGVDRTEILYAIED